MVAGEAQVLEAFQIANFYRVRYGSASDKRTIRQHLKKVVVQIQLSEILDAVDGALRL